MPRPARGCYGATAVDLGAPGRTILSTVPDGHYTNYFGTSMATSHVTGTAALILSRNPNLSYAQVKALILETSIRLRTWRARW